MVDAAAEMPPEFDARRSALRRHYRYLIWNDRLPDLWLRRWTWHLPTALTSAAMQAAADRLIGTHDFASFAGAPRARAGRSDDDPDGRAGALVAGRRSDRVRDHRERVSAAHGTWNRRDAGRGGTRAASNRHNSRRFSKAADRRQAGPNAPPHGLMLTGVDYPAQFEVDRQGALGATGCRARRSSGARSADRRAPILRPQGQTRSAVDARLACHEERQDAEDILAEGEGDHARVARDRRRRRAARAAGVTGSRSYCGASTSRPLRPTWTPAIMSSCSTRRRSR